MKLAHAIGALLLFAACDGDPSLSSSGDGGDDGQAGGGDSDADPTDPNRRGTRDGAHELAPGEEAGAAEDAGAEAEPVGTDAGMPETFSGTCDPIRQLGCGAGEACDRTCGTASGLGCRPVAPTAGAQKAPCSVAGDAACAPGYTCITISSSNYCTKICTTGADCPSTAIHCNPIRCGWTDKTGPYVMSGCSPF